MGSHNSKNIVQAEFNDKERAAEALGRMLRSANSLELKEAFDEYLAILDRSGLPELPVQEARKPTSR
jgi:hypothetical protein